MGRPLYGDEGEATHREHIYIYCEYICPFKGMQNSGEKTKKYMLSSREGIVFYPIILSDLGAEIFHSSDSKNIQS